MLKKVYIIFFICFTTSFTYNKELNDLYNLYYSANTNEEKELSLAIDNIKKLKLNNIEKQTYDNIILLMQIYIHNKNKREAYKLLNDNIKNNTPLLSEKDSDYMASVADVMSSAINYSSFNYVVKLFSMASEIYDKSLKINNNHFPSLLGKAILISYTPTFIGGGVDKAIATFKKAEQNAKEKWEKHILYLWLSQAYFKMGDKNNYNKYIKLAKDIFPNGSFIINVIGMNNQGKSMFD